MKIYLVIGNSGEYSDYREWIVCGYTRYEDAVSRANLLKALVPPINSSSDYLRIPYEEREAIQQNVRTAPNGDPDAQIDYTGVDWRVVDVNVKEKL